MEKILKILKINLLSILALPILLLATVSKLIAKAMEKLAVVLGMTCLTLALYAFFEILKNPGSILTMIAFLVVFIIVIAILIAILHFCFAVLVSMWTFITLIFNTIYEYTHLGYLKLYEICTRDYSTLTDSGKRNMSLPCLFYSVLNGISKAIVWFVSISLYLSIGLSVLIVFSSLISLNSNVKTVLGINLMAFVSKFDTFSLVYGIVMYIAIMATVIATLLSLGIEWYKWAKELKMTSNEYSNSIRQLRDNQLLTVKNELLAVENETAEDNGSE